ncbi:MAG: CarD family transcriptional regulator [bacterium]
MDWIDEISAQWQGSPKWIAGVGLTPASSAYLLARLFPRLQRSVAVIAPTTKDAEKLAEDLRFFRGASEDLFFFPNLDVLPYFQLSPHPDVLAERLGTLYELAFARSPRLIVTSHSALLRRLPPRSIFNQYADYVVSKEEIDRESLLRKLVEAGYLSVPLVEDAGTFSVRGGILDIFPPHSPHPYRVELFGDRVESLRLFEPSTQRSLREVEELVILPAREVVLNETTIARATQEFRKRFDELGLPKSERDEILTPLKNRLPFPALETFLPFFYESTATLLDYLPKDSLLFSVGAAEAGDHAQKLWEELKEAQAQATSPERIVGPEEIFLTQEEWEKERLRFGGMETGSFSSRETVPGEPVEPFDFKTQTNELIRTKILPPTSGAPMLEPLADYFKEQTALGLQVVLSAGSETQKLRLKDLFERLERKIEEFAGPPLAFFGESSAHHGGLFLTTGSLSQGFHLPGDRFLFVTDEEIFGTKIKRPRKAPPPSETFSAFEDLKTGDYVVHTEHGVGLYKGLTKLTLGAVEGEFLLLEYLGGDKLYLPVYRLHLIQRYTGESGYAPELDKLGGTHWVKTQEKVKKAIRAMAGELLKIYAARAAQTRKPYGGGGELFEEFEASFPYEETRDQEAAIADVLRDMEGEKPMDRLVCGDVGFGKTEVALRAAFKAVLDGRQVAVLVPTTILAFQHYETFLERMKSFGARVEMLSRFRSAAEQKEIVKALEKGEIDVVVGTHRLLQPDLKFKNLGLLVIDEEHRFGVAHKEKIKKLRNLVDVLTLTATPIPAP